jgi:Fic family protein
LGHRDAIAYIEHLSRSKDPIGEWQIKEIHTLIMRGVDWDEAGRYRQVNVRSAGTEYPYPDHYLVPQLMTDFAQWLSQECQ